MVRERCEGEEVKNLKPQGWSKVSLLGDSTDSTVTVIEIRTELVF